MYKPKIRIKKKPCQLEKARSSMSSEFDRLAPPMMVKAFIFYELQSTINLDKLIASPKEGIKDAVDQFPFMAGNLQVDDLGKPWIVTLPEKQLDLSIRHFAGTEYTHFSALAKDSFPPTIWTIPSCYPNGPLASNGCAPLQLNIIVGGLILGCAMHHTVGDWTSMDTFLATTCRDSKAYHHNLKIRAQPRFQ